MQKYLLCWNTWKKFNLVFRTLRHRYIQIGTWRWGDDENDKNSWNCEPLQRHYRGEFYQLTSHPDRSFELLQDPPVFPGKILGGCIDSIYDFFDGEWYADMPLLCEKYRLFPDLEDWKGRILLLESSEKKMFPEKTGRFGSISREPVCLMLFPVSWWVSLWLM